MPVTVPQVCPGNPDDSEGNHAEGESQGTNLNGNQPFQHRIWKIPFRTRSPAPERRPRCQGGGEEGGEREMQIARGNHGAASFFSVPGAFGAGGEKVDCFPSGLAI